MSRSGDRVAKCDQKIKGVAAKPMPLEFRGDNWPETQSSEVLLI